MGLFSRRQKKDECRKPDSDVKVVQESNELHGRKPNLCVECKKYNYYCPYGTNTYCIACSSFVKGDNSSKVGLCPFCGSPNVYYNNYHESGNHKSWWNCHKCGRSFPSPSYGP